jgi:hypothetical protein
MIFPKSQWKDWARDWGLSHRAQQGWLAATERVAGERKGLLIRVGWGPGEDPGLKVCVRFPRVIEPERLRQALIADAALDTLPGKGAARRKMEIEGGAPRKVIRLGERPEFLLSENSLVWSRTFNFSTPKAAQVREWVDTLVEAVARATPPFDGRCESCGSGGVRPYVLVDDLPVLMCATCQHRLSAEGDMAERTYEMIEVRHLSGALLALAAVAAGAVVWAALGALTQRIYSAVAIGIGALVAWTYRRGAGRVDHAGRAIAAVLTLGSVVLGEILLYAWWVAKANPDVGFRLDAGVYVFMKTWAESPGQEIASMVFGLVGAWFATQALERPKVRASIEPASRPAIGDDEQKKAA